MDEVTAGSGAPASCRNAPAGRAVAAVRVYYPGDGRDVIHVEVDGQWVAYKRARRESLPEPLAPPEPQNLHWAGYTCHSPYEITPEPKRRVYYDPTDRPDMFIVKDGEPPTRPLPVLDLNGHAEDPEPWLDPETGNRFSSDQARTTIKLLRYAPREAASITARPSVYEARFKGRENIARCLARTSRRPARL